MHSGVASRPLPHCAVRFVGVSLKTMAGVALHKMLWITGQGGQAGQVTPVWGSRYSGDIPELCSVTAVCCTLKSQVALPPRRVNSNPFHLSRVLLKRMLVETES